MKRGFALLAGALLVAAVQSPWTSAAGPSLAIYQQWIGVVEETRPIPTDLDLDDVRFAVPEELIFDSLSVTLPGTVLSQAFHFTRPSDLLDASIGQVIEVLAQGGDYPRLLRGTLLATGDVLVLRDERGQIQLLRDPLAVTLPRRDDLPLDPYISLRLAGDGLAGAEATLIYETRGLSWSASYVAILDEQETTLALRGSLALVNRSGWDFRGAAIRLVAGEIGRAEETSDLIRYAAAPMAEAAFGEAPAFEYHVYTLAGSFDLLDGASFAIPYSASEAVSVKKTYTYDGARADGVAVGLEFVNETASGIGIPLPGGVVRVFQTLASGTLLLGEVSIGHTPVDEKVSLSVGSAFDLVGERVEVSSERIATSTYRETYRITLRNHKTAAVTIAVLEHPGGSSWEVLSASPAYERIDARTIRFQVEVPADGEATVEYTVEYSY